ncbi:unnamed protein product [Notodromas monacha]|uniref:Uncharacterized protein n=1 Tax=Notodromas monacha TaxID=399045 RepID=A0A7R9BRT7_9CRUS|nr:unnamed protein product [Notodromas monacha]CAG0920165.1 unnamed protein product [Notodromas monacha]
MSRRTPHFLIPLTFLVLAFLGLSVAGVGKRRRSAPYPFLGKNRYRYPVHLLSRHDTEMDMKKRYDPLMRAENLSPQDVSRGLVDEPDLQHFLRRAEESADDDDDDSDERNSDSDEDDDSSSSDEEDDRKRKRIPSLREIKESRRGREDDDDDDDDDDSSEEEEDDRKKRFRPAPPGMPYIALPEPYGGPRRPPSTSAAQRNPFHVPGYGFKRRRRIFASDGYAGWQRLPPTVRPHRAFLLQARVQDVNDDDDRGDDHDDDDDNSSESDDEDSVEESRYQQDKRKFMLPVHFNRWSSDEDESSEYKKRFALKRKFALPPRKQSRYSDEDEQDDDDDDDDDEKKKKKKRVPPPLPMGGNKLSDYFGFDKRKKRDTGATLVNNNTTPTTTSLIINSPSTETPGKNPDPDQGLEEDYTFRRKRLAMRANGRLIAAGEWHQPQQQRMRFNWVRPSEWLHRIQMHPSRERYPKKPREYGLLKRSREEEEDDDEEAEDDDDEKKKKRSNASWMHQAGPGRPVGLIRKFRPDPEKRLYFAKKFPVGDDDDSALAGIDNQVREMAESRETYPISELRNRLRAVELIHEVKDALDSDSDDDDDDSNSDEKHGHRPQGIDLIRKKKQADDEETCPALDNVLQGCVRASRIAGDNELRFVDACNIHELCKLCVNDEETCPALDNVLQGCVRASRIAGDNELRFVDACNIHELCKLCGNKNNLIIEDLIKALNMEIPQGEGFSVMTSNDCDGILLDKMEDVCPNEEPGCLELAYHMTIAVDKLNPGGEEDPNQCYQESCVSKYLKRQFGDLMPFR